MVERLGAQAKARIDIGVGINRRIGAGTNVDALRGKLRDECTDTGILTCGRQIIQLAERIARDAEDRRIRIGCLDGVRGSPGMRVEDCDDVVIRHEQRVEADRSGVSSAHRQKAEWITDDDARSARGHLACGEEEADERGFRGHHHHDDIGDIPARDPVQGAGDTPASLDPGGHGVRRPGTSHMSEGDTGDHLAGLEAGKQIGIPRNRLR